MARWTAFAICLGLVLLATSQAHGADRIGDTYEAGGGAGCSHAGGTYIQAASPGNGYAVPYDGVIVSWGFQVSYVWSASPTFKVARLGVSDTFTVIGSDGPRSTGTHPVRIPVRQGDVIGARIPAHNTTACMETGAYTLGRSNDDVPAGANGLFADYSSYRVPIEATIERDRDNDGYGDETQDGCPTNASTQGACPLPTTLGQTFTPINSAVTIGTAIPALPSDQRFVAPGDGVITSWSYQANSLVDGTAKLKAVRPLGGDGFQVVAESEPQAPSPNTLNTFPARLAVRAGDRIGITAYNLPISSSVSDVGSSWFASSDPAPGSSAVLTLSNRRTNVSAALEADADGDGYGDTTQDLCPSDATTQGQCRALEPPGESKACEKARMKLRRAKAKLKKLRKNDAKPKAIEAAKKKVKRAKRTVKKAC